MCSFRRNPIHSTPLTVCGDGESPPDSGVEVPRLDKSMTQSSFNLQNESLISTIHEPCEFIVIYLANVK